MKGLLLQDIYLMKKNLILAGFICIYFLIILLLGSEGSASSQIDLFTYGLCGIFPCFLTSCACFTINTGKNSKSTMFIRTCPLDIITITLEKYILTYALLICSYVIISIFVFLNQIWNAYTPNKNMFYICFLIFSVIFLFLNIQLPIILRFGQAVASGVLVAVLCFSIIIGLVAVIKIAAAPDLYKEISSFFSRKSYIGILVILIDILSMTGSFSLAKSLNQS